MVRLFVMPSSGTLLSVDVKLVYLSIYLLYIWSIMSYCPVARLLPSKSSRVPNVGCIHISSLSIVHVIISSTVKQSQ